MSYYIDSSKVSLDDLQKRIETTDLVPSRASLLDGIDLKFKILKQRGFKTLADLRQEIKNARNIPSFSKKTGIDTNYLTLLRREIEGYFPKALPINSFDWFDKKDILKLESSDYNNTALLYEVLIYPQNKQEIINTLGIDTQFLETIFILIDLTRIQWISPIVARMLVSAGYKNPEMVSNADAEKLCNELEGVNTNNKYFKGKIGLRDVKRIIKAASYVS